MNFDLLIEEICEILLLGEVVSPPQKLSGSKTDSILYHIITPNGHYVIKFLGPSVDITDEAIVKKYNRSESIAQQFISSGMQSVVALPLNGKFLHLVRGWGVLVYPWVEGRMLTAQQHTVEQSDAMALLLAQIHKFNLNSHDITPTLPFVYNAQEIDDAVALYESNIDEKLDTNLHKYLHENMDRLAESKELLLHSVRLTHGDIHPHNVIWNGNNEPILIDWEAVKLMNPTWELIRTALTWSDSHIRKFESFVAKYCTRSSCLASRDIEVGLLATFGNAFFWFMYNMKQIEEGKAKCLPDKCLEESHGSIETIQFHQNNSTLLADILHKYAN